MGFVAWLTLWATLHYKQSGYFWATVILITGVFIGAKLRTFYTRGALYAINITLISTIL